MQGPYKQKSLSGNLSHSQVILPSRSSFYIYVRKVISVQCFSTTKCSWIIRVLGGNADSNLIGLGWTLMPAFPTSLQWTVTAHHVQVARPASLSSPRTGAHFTLRSLRGWLSTKRTKPGRKHRTSACTVSSILHPGPSVQTPGLPSCPGGAATFLLS